MFFDGKAKQNSDMDLIGPELARYAERHSSPEAGYLRELDRETQAKVLMPRMLSGHLQGNLLATLSCLMQPRRVLEIGTFTGYSTICLAQGLAEGGRLTTIDLNLELEDMVRGAFAKAGLTDRIDYLLGDARQVVPTLTDTFDLVFIDADKASYAQYYQMVIDKVRKGGLIIADNVLWSGKVLAQNADKDTRTIQAFNEMVQADERVMNTLLPIRDGLMLMYKL
jgi:caffeoyl-CoA O-methyltransferase